MIHLNLATGKQTELISQDAAVQVAVSPDGARAAFLGRRVKEVRGVGVKPLEGGDWKTIATLEGNGYYLQWMPDGVSLVATKEDNPNSALFRIPAQGGPPEKVGEFPGLQHVHSFRVHPNGRQALFQSEVTRTELWALENFLPKQLAAR